MHTKSFGAFSLIELIVVIAIVGILAATSFTAYKSYLVKARVSALVNVVNIYKDKSVLFAQQHGYFPDPYDLGLAANPGDNVTDPSAIFPAEYAGNPTNLFGFYDDSDSVGFSGPCGAHMVMQLAVDAYDVGIPQVTAPNQGMVSLIVYAFNVNNTITALNIYYVYDGTSMLDQDLVNGWINYTDPQMTPRFTALENEASCQ